ncbi:MAG TPA: tetratricopeptide repeat protein, partial [Pyrinomonadaceae bacterium]|nr:tetratricopeptide repeat protein [Pyrinomonadaceae bacterium]
KADEHVRPAEVLTAAEAEQRVPKEALKAFRRGEKFGKDGEADKALASYTRAVELYPGYFQALAARGDLLVRRRELAEAAADFGRALKLNPQYAPALRGSGYCKLERKEFAEAAADFEKAVSAQPDNANTYLLLGIAYLELDHRAAAKEALFKALGSGSRQELRAYIYLANLYARERRYGEAAEELHKYLEAVPADPDATKLRAAEARWLALAASP